MPTGTLPANAPEGVFHGATQIGQKRALLDTPRGTGTNAVLDRIAVDATRGNQHSSTTDIYDREPMAKRWGIGCVTLLGDAAHPMTPHLGQGACQAIEDAFALAGCLRERASVEDALRLYESRRICRTAAIVRLSHRMGWVGQLESPWLCRLRDATVKKMPDNFQHRQLQMVLGYEP